MNVYDRTHELATALKSCSEVIELNKASKKVEENEKSKKMLQDFRKVQFEAYNEQMQKGKLSEETEKKLQGLGAVISMNPDVGMYLQAEARFAVIWEDIMKILNEAIDVKAGL